MRERQYMLKHVATLTGITPAYAGKTKSREASYYWHRDHPRLRGKDLFADKLRWAPVGSPPLTRERPAQDFMRRGVDGITPAYAGKTVIDPWMQAT